MRELNEQELNQVAGGFSINFNYGTQAQSAGAAQATFGGASSSSVTDSSLGYHGSNSFAANKSTAFGYQPLVESDAASTSGLTISAS